MPGCLEETVQPAKGDASSPSPGFLAPPRPHAAGGSRAPSLPQAGPSSLRLFREASVPGIAGLLEHGKRAPADPSTIKSF